jgi:hypothetical protein
MVTCLALGRSASPAAEQVGPYEWTGVTRIVVIGDVHGSYDKMVALLRGTEVIDEQLDWAGGVRHLVFVGDLTDRGPRERDVLDLARKLETQAEAVGGRVHVLLGNHEVMNMVGDLRYAEGRGLTDFQPFEQSTDREQEFAEFRKIAAKSGASGGQIRDAFNERYPSGFFGRLRAFSPEGEYGRWLNERSAVVKLNGYVFLHGGLTDRVAALGLDGINDGVHASLREFLDNRALVVGGNGLVSYNQAYSSAEALAASRSAKRKEPERVAAAQALMNHFDGLAFAPDGPLWYRGNSVENEQIERGSMERVLESLDAKAVVVAHTPTGTGVVTQRFNGRVLRTDVGMAYGREPFCLVLQDDQVTVFDPRTASYSLPPAEPPEGERFSEIEEQFPDKQFERFLERAEVVARLPVRRKGREGEVWSLEHKDLELRAVFLSVDEPAGSDPSEPARRYAHEVASYKLDRMMNLRLVPVTIVRDLDGKRGSLQAWTELVYDRAQLEEYGQLDQVRQEQQGTIMEALVFNALIGGPSHLSEGRADYGYMYVPRERRIMLADNTKAFPESGDVGDLLPEDCTIAADFALEMRSLDRKRLKQELGVYLSGAQIDGLLARRDTILTACGG